MHERIQRIQALNDLVTLDRAFCAQVIAALKARDARKVVSLATERGLTLYADDLFPSEAADLTPQELAGVAGGADTDGTAWIAQALGPSGCGVDALVRQWQGLL